MIRLCTATLAAGLAAAIVMGCEGDTTVRVVPVTVENSPPVILSSTPDFDDGERFEGGAPDLWIVPSDPDGADDIAAVFFHIDTVTLNSLIVRPDSAPEPCRRVNYSDMDTINVWPLLNSTAFEMNTPLSRLGSGAYAVYLDYFDLTDGGLVGWADEFGPQVKGCGSGLDYNLFFEAFGLYPPALPAPRDVHVTYADFTLRGVTFTVYDHAGATATRTYPDLSVYFTNPTEEATLP